MPRQRQRRAGSAMNKKRKTRNFSVDSAGHWPYVSVISKGNQARLARKIDK